MILINSVLDILPTYMMSLFPLPASVEKRLEGKERKRRRGSIVKWKTLTICKQKAGLEVRNLRKHNKSLLLIQKKALLMKWLWSSQRRSNHYGAM